MKKNRQEKLLEIIARYDVDTQDELIERLRDCGFETTQATISRDIRELKIAKMTNGKGSYRYVLPKQTAQSGDFKFNAALIDSIVHVDQAANITVLKTYPGLAQAVAVGIDGMHEPLILGCVAGDDTIIVVLRDEESAKLITSRIQDLLKTV